MIDKDRLNALMAYERLVHQKKVNEILSKNRSFFLKKFLLHFIGFCVSVYTSSFIFTDLIDVKFLGFFIFLISILSMGFAVGFAIVATLYLLAFLNLIKREKVVNFFYGGKIDLTEYSSIRTANELTAIRHILETQHIYNYRNIKNDIENKF